MNVAERKKKFVIGISLHTLGIVEFAVLIVLSMDGAWFLAFIGGAIHLPLVLVGTNLMVNQRWW